MRALPRAVRSEPPGDAGGRYAGRAATVKDDVRLARDPMPDRDDRRDIP
jgi:hypothetical protein